MENKKTYWKHRNAGGINCYAVTCELLDRFNYISIGWSDFSNRENLARIINGKMSAIESIYDENKWKVSKSRWNLYHFICEMKEGDIVLVPGFRTFSLYNIADNFTYCREDITEIDIPKNVDLGFFRKVTPIQNCQNLSRDILDDNLFRRIKIQQTLTKLDGENLRAAVDKIINNPAATSQIQVPSMQDFDISASAYRLWGTRKSKDGKMNLFGNSVCYNIPWYQRAYSWKEEQVVKLLSDLQDSYLGDSEDGKAKKEPLFIGNMQLTSIENNWCDVVDGQQRITTILILLKYISINYPKIGLIPSSIFKCLKTEVGGENEDIKLQLLLDIEKDNENGEDIENNTYIQNYYVIKRYFDQQEEENRIIDFSDFVEYLLNDIYFVVVTTRASISKTIQIFGTINTAGLDLNGGDMFKVRMYDYIRKKNIATYTSKDIDNLYKRIDDLNQLHHMDYTILRVLSIYKDYLIAKNQLPNILYKYGTEHFFNDLFECLTNERKVENFDKAKNIEIDLDIVFRLINIIYEWDTHKECDYERMFERSIIRTTRYANYQNVAYLILLISPNDYEKVYQCYHILSRTFITYSIHYGKSINEIHNLIYAFRRELLSSADGYEKAMQLIEGKSINIEKELRGYLADSAMNKNLVCRLSEYLTIVESGPSLTTEILCSRSNPCEKRHKCILYSSVEDLKKQLFDTKFDIEHIHANADTSIVISQEDMDLQNGIGNLALLEYNINRSIQAENLLKKKESYKTSNYYTIRKIASSDVIEWDKKHMEDRRDMEVKKILDFLRN